MKLGVNILQDGNMTTACDLTRAELTAVLKRYHRRMGPSDRIAVFDDLGVLYKGPADKIKGIAFQINGKRVRYRIIEGEPYVVDESI